MPDTEPTTRPLSARARFAFALLGGVMALIAVPVWTVTVLVSDRSTAAPFWPIGPLVVLLSFATALAPLRVEVKGETFAITMVEIPLVLGLLSGIWPPALVPCLILPVMLLSLSQRNSWQSQLINPPFNLVECGLPVMLFVVLQSDPALQRLGLILGAAVGTSLTCVAVNIVHRLRGAAEPIGSGLVRSILASTSTTIVAMVGVTLWGYDGNGSEIVGRGLAVALAVAMALLYRVYSRFLRQHLDLARIYEFGRRVTAMTSGTTDWSQLLEQVRDQLNAEVAAIHLTEPSGEVLSLAGGLDGAEPPLGLPDDQQLTGTTGDPTGDAILLASLRSGGVQVSSDRTSDPNMLAALDRRHAGDVLVVPLKVGDRNRGYLEVRDRRSRWARFSGNDLRVLGTLAQHMATALDNQRLVESLRHEAYHDVITGLLNWRGLIQRTEGALAAQELGAVLLMQLGILPEVNNAIGHMRGEQLLNLAGARVVDAMGGDPSAVAHLESDRFAVLVRARTEPEVERIAASLIDLVGSPYALEGLDVEPHVRIGIAYAEDPANPSDDASPLLQRAEMALTAAQAADVPMRAYGASMGEVFRRRFQLVTQFRRAVEQGRITVHYQPKLSLADRKLVGMEALVRWAHPEFGAVSPAEFVEAIEATGSIDVLLEHVLDIVLTQIALWSRRQMQIGVAVNLSVRNLSAPNFPAKVAAALAHHGVAPELLTFEITESSVMADPERSLPVLRDLHAMGIQLSVDDFGTGYSSLAYLRRLPIDEIKIDRSFVQGMITDLGDLAIVRAIIDLGHSLGLRVVAEGVEEEAARDALRTLRCDDLQGFLLARPMPIEKLEAWLMSRTVRSTRETSDPQVLRLIAG